MMNDILENKFGVPKNWKIEIEETHEKERINQSTEITVFTATAPDGMMTRKFTRTVFTDHKGSKENWSEKT